MKSRASCFSARERGALSALARAAMPAGRVFPGGSGIAVDKVDNFLALSPPAVAKGYRAMLWALEANAMMKHLRPLEKLSDEQLLALMEGWRKGDYGRRTVLRLLTTPLKVAHYNDQAMYDHVGCKFGSLPVAQAEKPRYMSERVTIPADLPDEETLDCDVVVIGTGAGGAVTAKELAERGHAVVLLEEGDYVDRSQFNGHAVEMQRKLYRDMGATIAVGNVSIPIPIGRSVGGTTTINSGTCYRAPSRIFDSWRTEHGLADYSGESMAPYYARVEEVLEVAPADMKYVGGVGRVIARGCDALGYKHAPLRRNAPACDGQGVCCFGCPSDAKRSTNVSYVPLALKAGAHLFTGLRAEKVLVEHGRAAGVVARGAGKTLTVRARTVVVACGSLLTPLFLERNKLGLRSGQLGRNLSIHPALAALALYDEVIDGANSIPQGYSIEEFHDEGILFEGAFAPLDIGAASFPILGKQLVELLEDYKRLACFGFMIEDTSRGRVRLGPGGRPFITYWMNGHDTARLKRGVEILSRVFLAGGARKVIPIVHGFDEFRSHADLERFRGAKVTARDFEITAYHPLGTARMGADPRSSVIGPDCQLHDTPGVYVTDGSAVPTSPAVNPQMTIMALATRAADGISARS
jgi:choline dehydrogenase-like flavoprotein